MPHFVDHVVSVAEGPQGASAHFHRRRVEGQVDAAALDPNDQAGADGLDVLDPTRVTDGLAVSRRVQRTPATRISGSVKSIRPVEHGALIRIRRLAAVECQHLRALIPPPVIAARIMPCEIPKQGPRPLVDREATRVRRDRVVPAGRARSHGRSRGHVAVHVGEGVEPLQTCGVVLGHLRRDARSAHIVVAQPSVQERGEIRVLQDLGARHRRAHLLALPRFILPLHFLNHFLSTHCLATVLRPRGSDVVGLNFVVSVLFGVEIEARQVWWQRGLWHGFCCLVGGWRVWVFWTSNLLLIWGKARDCFYRIFCPDARDRREILSSQR